MNVKLPVIAPRCRKAYRHDRKNCPTCKIRARSLNAYRKAAVRAGVWDSRWVAAAEVGARIAELIDAGYPITDQARKANLNPLNMRRILHGKAKWVTAPVAQAIMALELPPVHERTPRAGMVDATGVRRRLQGLAVDDWSWSDIAARLGGVTLQAVSQFTRQPRVSRVTYDKVVALTAEIGGLRGPSSIAGARAAARGWVPLDAWGDDIDDPAATPDVRDPNSYVDDAQVDRCRRGELAIAGLTRAERRRVVALLAWAGRSDREIAGITKWGSDLDKATAAVCAYRRNHGIAPGQTSGRVPEMHVDERRVTRALSGPGMARADQLTTGERIRVVTALAADGLSDADIGEWLSWSSTRRRCESAVQSFRRTYNIAAARPHVSRARVDRAGEPARVDLAA